MLISEISWCYRITKQQNFLSIVEPPLGSSCRGIRACEDHPVRVRQHDVLSTPMKKESECWMWRRLYVQYHMCMYIQVDKYFNLFTSDLFMNSSCLKYWKTPKGLTALRSGTFRNLPASLTLVSWHFPPIFCSTFQLFAENPQWKGCFKTLGKPMGLAYLKNSIRCFLAHWPRRHLLPKNWTSKDGEVQRWVAQPTQFGNATTAARNNQIIANKIRFQWNNMCSVL